MKIIKTKRQLRRLRGVIINWSSWDRDEFSLQPTVQFTLDSGQTYLINMSIYNFIQFIENND